MRDAAPIGITCPTIDKGLSSIESAVDRAKDIQDFLFEATEIIEEVRSANSTLRDWGNEQYQRAEELETENRELQDQIERFEYDIASLTETIEELESQLRLASELAG
jgi:predicted nuclease with TOPRIM domain